MKQQDFEPFCELLDLIAEQCSKKLSDGLKMLYWQGLKDYDIPALQQAAYRHLRNPDSGQFMIKIADFTKMIDGTTQDSALMAWAKVDKAVRAIGAYQDVVFDDAIIHRVIQDMGGWIGLNSREDKEWPFATKEFENRYRAFKARGEIPDYPRKLIGITTAYNEQHGIKIDQPMLVGNATLAQKVLAGGTDKPAIGFRKLDLESIQAEPKQLRAVG